MKSLLVLAALLMSAVPVKAADELSQKKVYFYGFVYGSGATLCGALEDKQITKEYAQYFLPSLVESLLKDPRNKGYTPSINKAYENIKKADVCKGVYP